MPWSVFRPGREILISYHLAQEGLVPEFLNLVILGQAIKGADVEDPSFKGAVESLNFYPPEDVGFQESFLCRAPLGITQWAGFLWILVVHPREKFQHSGLRRVKALELEHYLVAKSSPAVFVKGTWLANHNTLESTCKTGVFKIQELGFVFQPDLGYILQARDFSR